jgi:hypothetical protein
LPSVDSTLFTVGVNDQTKAIEKICPVTIMWIILPTQGANPNLNNE